MRISLVAWMRQLGVFLLLWCGAGAEEFQSPNGVKEECVRGVRVPGGKYMATDDREEQRLCAIDFYAKRTAMCPKMWSTSPATIVYDVSDGRFANHAAAFESQACVKGGLARKDAAGELAMYKMSMNAQDTSGTFSPSSLVYYHLSRYFETAVNVPVAVYRTIDKTEHTRRVIEPGVRFTAGKSSLQMVHAGWIRMEQAAKGDASFNGASELVTEEGKTLFGVLLTETGTRYGPEINGTRESRGIEGQNRDFQQTTAYRALRQNKPVEDAIRASGGKAGTAQMLYWMRELTEIILLDYILGQQDRIGNIDYTIDTYSTQGGELRLKRTWLNENDAGVRASYADFAQRTHMLDGVAHLSATTYGKLLRLESDLSERGELHGFLRESFGLSERQMRLIEKRTVESAAVLRRACEEKRLRFDLEPEEYLSRGVVGEKAMRCEGR